MRKRIGYTILGILLLVQAGYGQNFIGMTKSEIPAALKVSFPQFKPDRSMTNHAYNYLKFVDKISEQTLLFFLSDKDVCTYVRWMSDYSNLGDMTAMLNKKYHKAGPSEWTYIDKGENYTVKLEEGEWYFTLSFRKN